MEIRGKGKVQSRAPGIFKKTFIVKSGEGVEPRAGFCVYDDDCDNNHYHP